MWRGERNNTIKREKRKKRSYILTNYGRFEKSLGSIENVEESISTLYITNRIPFLCFSTRYYY